MPLYCTEHPATALVTYVIMCFPTPACCGSNLFAYTPAPLNCPPAGTVDAATNVKGLPLIQTSGNSKAVVPPVTAVIVMVLVAMAAHPFGLVYVYSITCVPIPAN